MSTIRACAVIPTHNHYTALGSIVAQLEAAGLPVIVVDDGSMPEASEKIRTICVAAAQTDYLRRPVNGGKGAAVTTGLERAQERGFSHAVQIDADGQHNLEALPSLLAASARKPKAIISGTPAFDDSMPTGRRVGRRITAFWVAVNTMSLRIEDAMCGFRVYPVSPAVALIQKSVRGKRMDFDIEVLIRADWVGIEIATVPVSVHYPEDNFSNFKLVADNLLLIGMQTRLFFGMLMRSPKLLMRSSHKSRAPDHWAGMAERGAYWGLRLLGAVYKIFGRRVCLVVMSPVILYFFLTGRVQRQASQDYLLRAWREGYLRKRPNLFTSLRHFMAFGSAVLDKIAAWSGRLTYSALDGAETGVFAKLKASGKGVVLLTAHIGNPEVIRAIASRSGKVRVHVLMHTKHSELFNRLIRQFSPNSLAQVVSVTDVGPAEAMFFADAVARGEWVVIAADRIPVRLEGRTVNAPFLGEDAPFPQGPFILGALLRVPVFFLFCVRDRGRYRIQLTCCADPILLPRHNRLVSVAKYAAQFATALEGCVAHDPLQWFNFYPFWNPRRVPIAQQKVAE